MELVKDPDFDGKVIIFTAPSGAGKTTVVRHLLTQYPDQIAFSVSATSRAPRAHEKESVDYYFMTPKDFMLKVEDGQFLEWEEVYEDQYYGTLFSEFERIWASERHIIFDVDVKGAENIKNQFGHKCLAIFIRPPSLQVLVDRLKNRKTETPASLRKRIARVKKELTYEDAFDQVLVNDILEVALKDAELMLEEFIISPNLAS